MKNAVILIGFIALMSGCASESVVDYASVGENYIGSADELSYTELNSVADQAVQRLLTDPLFSKRYAAARTHAQADGRENPGLIVDPIENNINAAGDESTEQMRTILKDAIRKTGKFDIVDRAFRTKVTNDNIDWASRGESGGAISGIGSFVPGEFVMKGEVTRYESVSGKRRIYHHNVNFKMQDAVRGDLFWTTVISIDKAEVVK